MFIGKLNSESTGPNIMAINRSISSKNEALTGKKPEEATDRLIISPAGKKQGLMEQLMNRKQELMERKASLTDSEQGATLKEQAEEIDQQIKEIDQQITSLMSETEETEKEDKTGVIYEKPKTKEEAGAKQMQALSELANSSGQTEVISSVKDKLDGRISVLESEISSGYGNLEAKMEEAADLESRSNSLAQQTAEALSDINTTVSENSREAAAVREEDISDTKEANGQEEEPAVQEQEL